MTGAESTEGWKAVGRLLSLLMKEYSARNITEARERDNDID